MSTFIDICPGANPASPSDRTAHRIGWIGSNPDNPSQTGCYLKGPVWIGGTSTSNAAIAVDAAGVTNIVLHNTSGNAAANVIVNGDGSGSLWACASSGAMTAQLRGNDGLVQGVYSYVENQGSGGIYGSTRGIRIGSYYLWVDSSGRLRVKGSAPTGDTDGTVVGTQGSRVAENAGRFRDLGLT